MSFEDALKSLNDSLTALIACKKAAQEAQQYADETENHYWECVYWADKLAKRKVLFDETL